MDFVQGHDNICLLKESLHEIRNNVNKYSKELFENAEKLASTINVQPSIPRTCGIQRHRDNLPAADPLEYYKRSLLIPFLDHMISQIETRFSGNNTSLMKGLAIIPKIVI